MLTSPVPTFHTHTLLSEPQDSSTFYGTMLRRVGEEEVRRS